MSKFWRGTKVIIILASSLAKKIEDLIVGANSVCFNRESGENEYSYGISITIVGRVYAQA